MAKAWQTTISQQRETIRLLTAAAKNVTIERDALRDRSAACEAINKVLEAVVKEERAARERLLDITCDCLSSFQASLYSGGRLMSLNVKAILGMDLSK